MSPRSRRSIHKNIDHLTIHTSNPDRLVPTSRPRMFALHHRNRILRQPTVPSAILYEIVVVLHVVDVSFDVVPSASQCAFHEERGSSTSD